ncbi:hypothetical protein AFLA_004053 [Aspergillus flavus NRRL3357]|nr:hypothetical protein AFLA_004053 [Aspergillus flavus NRRL3357]
MHCFFFGSRGLVHSLHGKYGQVSTRPCINRKYSSPIAASLPSDIHQFTSLLLTLFRYCRADRTTTLSNLAALKWWIESTLLAEKVSQDEARARPLHMIVEV